MRLKSFRILNFKGILDTDWVDVEELTTLVGKNSCGKTSILQGLSKLNPYFGDYWISDLDFPRIYGSHTDRKSIITGIFLLSDNETDDLKKLIESEDVGALYQITRYHDGFLRISQEPDDTWMTAGDQYSVKSALRFKGDLNTLLNGITEHELTTDILHAERFSKEININGLRNLILKWEAPPKKPPPDVIGSSSKKMSRPHVFSQAKPGFEEPYRRYSDIWQAFSNIPETDRKIRGFIYDHLPFFVYVSEMRPFSGRMTFDSVPENREITRPTGDGRTVLKTDMDFFPSLSVISQLSSEYILSSQISPREKQLRIDKAAGMLDGIACRRWNALGGRPKILGNGLYLGIEFLVNDENSLFNNSRFEFDEMPYGWRNFVSLLLNILSYPYVETYFMGSKQFFSHRINPIILIDEPGLHLDPVQQKVLLGALKEVASGTTVFYSTHSPFLVDTANPSSIKVVEMTKGEGTIVKSEEAFFSKDYNNKMFLQAALGMGNETSYLLAEKNLVVEGPSDYILIKEFSLLLERSGENGLDSRILVCSGGSASEAKTLAHYMAVNRLDVLLLLDSDNEGKGKKQSFDDNVACLQEGKVCEAKLLSEITESGDEAMSIEDIFEKKYYLQTVSPIHPELSGVKAEVIEHGPGETFAKRIENYLKNKGVTFNKLEVSKNLRDVIKEKRNLAEAADILVVEKVKNLIKNINAVFADA